MTVAQLIAALQKCPQDAKVYKESGDYQDDWREVQSAAHGQVWQFKGVFLEWKFFVKAKLGF
jgi:hypothetical protein